MSKQVRRLQEILLSFYKGGIAHRECEGVVRVEFIFQGCMLYKGWAGHLMVQEFTRVSSTSLFGLRLPAVHVEQFRESHQGCACGDDAAGLNLAKSDLKAFFVRTARRSSKSCLAPRLSEEKGFKHCIYNMV